MIQVIAKPETFRPTAQMIDAARAVFAAMAYEATVRPIVETYQINILRALGYDETMLGREYRMPDDDLKQYYAQCRIEHKKAGFDVPDDYCPLLMAENETRKAKRRLVDVSCPVLFEDVDADRLLCSGLEIYDKFVDLTLRMLAAHL